MEVEVFQENKIRKNKTELVPIVIKDTKKSYYEEEIKYLHDMEIVLFTVRSIIK